MTMTTSGTPRAGLSGATLGFFVGFAAVALFGPTAHAFQQSMQLGPMAVALLVSAPALSGALLRIPFSAWADTTGGRRPFLVLLVLSAVGMGGLTVLVNVVAPAAFGPGCYPLLLALGLLSGCGIATFSVGVTQVSYWFPQQRQGRALGFFGGVGNLAPGLFSLVLPVALPSLGIATCYLVWLLFLVAGTALYAALGRNAWYFQLRDAGAAPAEARRAAAAAGQELFPAARLTDSLVASARSWKTWALVILYFTSFGGFIALTAWLPTCLQAAHGVDLVTAGLLTGGWSVLSSVVRAAGGAVADRLGGVATAVAALVGLAGGAALLVIADGLPLAFAAAALVAVAMGLNNAAVFKLVPQEVPQAVGGAAGWVGGLGALGGFAIPPMMAAFVVEGSAASYARGFSVFLVLAGGALVCALALRAARRPARTLPDLLPADAVAARDHIGR